MHGLRFGGVMQTSWLAVMEIDYIDERGMVSMTFVNLNRSLFLHHKLGQHLDVVSSV